MNGYLFLLYQFSLWLQNINKLLFSAHHSAVMYQTWWASTHHDQSAYEIFASHVPKLWRRTKKN